MIYLGSDHAGFELKEFINQYLRRKGLDFKDVGTYSLDSCDYPVFANLVCESIKEKDDRGVLICGSGVGVSIAANRHSHVRAALCFTREISKLSREHNDANVLCMGARFLDGSEATGLLEIFLATEFCDSSGRHQRRIQML